MTIKNKILFSFMFAILVSTTFAQTKTTKTTDTKTVTNFEKYITAGNKPPYSDAQTQYQTDMRVIVWNDPLIKDYKYSNESFDKLGYEFVKSNTGDKSQSSKIYRNCAKGIIIEVTEWHRVKLSISMQWYSTSVKNQIGYLKFCK